MNSVSTQFVKQLVRGLMLAGAMLVAPFASADDFRIESRQGPVESVDYSANKMVVGGVSYDIALEQSAGLTRIRLGITPRNGELVDIR